ncbi:hypothetical protein BX600DRAFT_474790 [Xylariales sp. PMI_506]|nr:hypothetical protein BX600DRAFT_474790 [Xylariales sp. PMI_506]
MKHPGSMARMIHYPPQSAKGEGVVGLPAHTVITRPPARLINRELYQVLSQDYECLTVLSQGRVPALQVLNNRGQWLLATPYPVH